MKKIIILFLCVFIFPINVFASSVLMDIDSKRIFYQNNMNEQGLIASTTKIMTAILAIESNRLSDIVPIGAEVLKMYGSNIYIELNEHMLLLDLIYGLMLRSGNDAAIVIANYVGGNEKRFIDLMNKKAIELGMTNTVFSNPHGLDEETKNYSTPYDLSILYSYAYKNETFRNIVGTKVYKTSTDFKSYYWENRNELLKLYDKATGGKTGFTPLAGRILVSSASNDDLNLCMVTIDKNSYLYETHESKYEEVFNNYKNYLLVDKNNFSLTTSLNGNFFIKDSFTYPLTVNERESISIKTKIDESKTYKNDSVVGQVLVYLDNNIIGNIDIYIEKSKNNIFSKIKNFFSNLLAIN